MNPLLKICSAVFLCSLSALAFEVTLMRIFSISLWYHFAFMIISIAMLGTGASGTLLSLYPGLRKISNIGIYSLLLGISISLSYLISNRIPFDPVQLSWSGRQLFVIGLYYICLPVPFFFTGLVIATALSVLSDKSGLLYGADLSGAGVGSASVLYFLTISGPDRIVFLLSLAALLASFICGGRKTRILALLVAALSLSAVLIHPSFAHLRISPYKGLPSALRYPGAGHIRTYYSPYAQLDIFKSSAARFAPGLSLRFLDALPDQIGFAIDGGELNAVTEYKYHTALKFVPYLPSALPYVVTRFRSDAYVHSAKSGSAAIKSDDCEFLYHKPVRGDILILEPKGGLQTLVAEYYGYQDIYKIESNPLLVKAICRDLNDFSGGIYSHNTWPGLGRSWLKNRTMQFDIIDMPMTGASPSGSFGIVEDYRLTTEAFREYLKHLKQDGFISIGLFILPPPRIELRILNTAIRSLEESGIQDFSRHIAAIRSWGSLCILIKKSPLNHSDIEAIRSFSETRRFDLIYYPGIRESETNRYVRMPTDEYFAAFQSLLNFKTRWQFSETYIFNVNPVYDEKPFFHYYLKLKNIREIYRMMGGKWQYFIEEGYILPAIFIQVLSISIVLMILPAVYFSKNRRTQDQVNDKASLGSSRRGFVLLPYFSLIAIGFMFVEIPVIQKMILPLENPSYALATALTSILISSAVGSLMSHRFAVLRTPSLIFVLSGIIFAYSTIIPVFFDIITSFPLEDRIFLAFAMLIPLGLLMGIPFPLGLNILGKSDDAIIPWAWAVNGCFSVLSPILAVLLAMTAGFRTVFWTGAGMYLIAYIILQSYVRRET